MIRYMLDTDICIAIIKNRPQALKERLIQTKSGEVVISSIVSAELWYGVANSQKKRQNEVALRDFLSYIYVVDWSFNAAYLYGEIRSILQKKGHQ